MSRNKDKMIKVLNDKGYEVTVIDWRPVTSGALWVCQKMVGRLTKYRKKAELQQIGISHHYNNIWAYNVDEAMEDIEKLPQC